MTRADLDRLADHADTIPYVLTEKGEAALLPDPAYEDEYRSTMRRIHEADE